MGRFGVAVFGLGRAGMIHVSNILGNCRCRLLYLVDLDESKMQQVIENYNLDDVTSATPDQADKVFNDPKVDAVVVSAPTFEHEKIVKGALRRGKAVFCEKPISESEAGTVECYDEAEKARRPLICSFNRRFDPSIRQLRNRVKAGEIGGVYSVHSVARDHPFPSIDYLRISGGIFHDCVVHDLDLICWVLGEYPVEIYTQAHCHDMDIAALGDVDTVAITLKFPSNVIGVIDASRHASYGYDQRIEVFGKEGMLVSENQRATNLTKYEAKGTRNDPLLYSFPQRYADSYKLALEHFLNVIEGKEEMEITRHNTCRISQLATLCENSYKLGKAIKITEDGLEVMNGTPLGDGEV